MQYSAFPQMIQLLKKFDSMPWENKNFYAQWLAQSRHYTSYSTRLLCFAAGVCSLEQQGLYRRFVQHIREESGHDILALKDIESLGFDISKMPELEATRSLWEPQFYKITRQPSSLLGYILALEILAVERMGWLYKKTVESYGEKALRFVKVHADDDPDHVEKAVEEIEKCSVAEREEIAKGYAQACVAYELLLDQALATAGRELSTHSVRSGAEPKEISV